MKQLVMMPLSKLLFRHKDTINIQEIETYKRITIRMNNQGIIMRDCVLGSEIGTKKQFIAKSGQLVLSKIDARNSAFGILPKECDGAIITGNFWAFDVNYKLLDTKYFNYLTHTALFVEFCIKASEGTTNRRYLDESKFLSMQIPLPPLDEQRRIVARIEELAAKVEEARGLRRQSAKEAEVLLSAAAFKAFTKFDSKNLVSIESICEVKGGIQKSSDRTPGANPRRYITVAHVQRNWIDTGEPRYFEVSDEELERWRLLSGDVLIIEGNGSADHIGRTALFTGEIEDCVHQNHVIRVRPNQSKLMPEYLNTYLNSPLGRDQMLKLSRTTSGLFTLSVGRIKSIKIPVPPLSEQRRIVAYLDNLQSKVDALKGLQAETAAELDALLPSILDKAFKGEL
ncbi:restriction endonuclease subunit S [Microcoleus sp. F6_B4]